MCSGEESYEWWHYCASGKRHPGVSCLDYWLSLQSQKYKYQKYLESEVDAADKDKYPLDKESKTMESMMDKFEENKMNWAKFNKTHCEGKKCG